MPGDPHPRSAHRANPEGGLALLTRQALAGPALARQVLARQGLTRQAPPQHRQTRAAHARSAHSHAARPQRPRRGPWPGPWRGPWRTPRAPQQAQQAQRALQTLMSGMGAVIIVSIIGLSAFFIVADERRGRGDSAAPPAVSSAAIASREVDAEPLSQREVFPQPEIRLVSGATPYQITMTHIDTDCHIATTGELGALLAEHGCDQVVRAGLIAPFGGYQVTVGVFNLAEEAGAAQVSADAAALVETGRGSFAAMGGLGSDPLAEPLAQVGWQHRGHFLLYCVIARPDGSLVQDDDPYAERITADLIGHYLDETIISNRAGQP
ncbi:hypothetical protein ACIBSW_27965 [Actinoplanes sp. NPDC049668]|uniref:hypothetical protein n=1 Tax=unclassified Actinoplanes TaxID=2626549 RepID=UPI0033A7B3CF